MKHPIKSAMNTFCMLSITFALTLLLGCEKEVVEEKEVLRPVRTLQVTPAQIGNTRIFSGVSQSEQEVQLSFRIPGTVIKLPIKVGDRLKKGDLVAQLDPATYELQAAQSRASLAQANAAQRNASSAYQRIKGLYENNNAAKTDLDSARASAESAQAQVRAAQKALQLARLNVRYTRLTSEADCAVARRNVEVNENVNSGTPVVSVDCGSELKVDIAVPESLIAEVKNGQSVKVHFSAIPNKAFNGTVAEVGVSATGAGSTFPVSVAINDKDNALRSGLAAEVTMQFTEAGSVSSIYLPVSAINKNNNGEFVYIASPIKNEKGKAIIELRHVKIGQLTDQGVAIVSGLKAGERVVIAGTKVIRPGLTVLLK